MCSTQGYGQNISSFSMVFVVLVCEWYSVATWASNWWAKSRITSGDSASRPQARLHNIVKAKVRCLSRPAVAFSRPRTLLNAPAITIFINDGGSLAEMATKHQENTALLTEHFRYTPLVRFALNAGPNQANHHRPSWTTSSTQSTN